MSVVDRPVQRDQPAAGSVRSRLADIVDAVEILGPTRFRLAGGAPFEAGSAGPAALRPLLTSVLYARAYARPWTGVPVSPDTLAVDAAPAPDDGFIDRLAAANPGPARWDDGWEVYALGEAGVIHARKDDAHRMLRPGEFAFAGGPVRVAGVGSIVAALVVHELAQHQAGYYHAFGTTPGCQLDEASTVRVYFNVERSATPTLVEHLVRTLDRYAVPFRLKCLTPRAEHDRSDACVLYVADRFTPITLRLVAGLPAGVLAALRPETPLFTCRLRPGIGLAEDPPNGESFGLSRVRLLTDGLVDAWRRGASSTSARLAAVDDAFAARGLGLTRPHLNRGSVDRFAWLGE